MTETWEGRESDYRAEERVRVCATHRRICAVDERHDRIVCPMGHDAAVGSFAVMTRSKAEALVPLGGTMPQGVKGSGPKDKKGRVSAIESASFDDGEGWRLRVTLRVNKGRYEVFVWHLSPDQKKRKSGVLDATETEAAARTRFNAEVQKARNMGWQPALNRRGGGGLRELPAPRPVKPAARAAGGGAGSRVSRA